MTALNGRKPFTTYKTFQLYIRTNSNNAKKRKRWGGGRLLNQQIHIPSTEPVWHSGGQTDYGEVIFTWQPVYADDTTTTLKEMFGSFQILLL